MATEYDYIVVGSGAGGGAVAGNLAKAGYKVLLLEAGSDGSDDPLSQVPLFNAKSTEDPELRWDFFVKHYSDPARQREDPKFNEENDGIYYPRAGTLGGCTAHNAMITVYPSNRDWDRIAEATQDSSWNSDNMRKYFERLERCRYGPGSICQRLIRMITFGLYNPSWHGYNGWLGTDTADPTLVFPDKSLVEIVLQAGFSVLETSPGSWLDRLIRFIRGAKQGEFDPNDWRRIPDQSGLAATVTHTSDGERNGTREFVKQVQKDFPQNLTIQTNALVSKVLFDDENKAIGVEYLEGKKLYRADRDPNMINPEPGTKCEAHVKREVILSGGAFNTPQMLMLSGIGPKEELAKHGIETRVDLPGVGRNLQDRYEVTVITKMKENFVLLKGAQLEPSPNDRFFVEWEKYREGVYTSNGVLIGVIKRSEPQRPDPDLYIFGIPGFFKGYFTGYSQAHTKDKDFFTWAILKGHTRNTAGRITLKSNDPRDTPDINFRYFNDDPDVPAEVWQEDLNSVVDGVQFVRRMNDHPDLQQLIETEYLPGRDIKTPEQIREHIEKVAWGHHASCTCKIGPKDDEMAVLDSNFRVYGTKNLRVVDASVFPHIPGLFIVAAVYMVGEKASDVILADAKNS